MKNDSRVVFRQKRLFSLVLIVPVVMLLLVYAMGCSSGDDAIINSGGGGGGPFGVTPEGDGTIGADGGYFQVGKATVEFPANSVRSVITVTGKQVSLNNLPQSFTLLSGVYEIKVSEPDEYVSDSANLSFELNEDFEDGDVSIFYSSDGVMWQKLESTVPGNTVSASVPGFGYFTVVQNRVTYTLKVNNKSGSLKTACLFQYDSQWLYAGITPVVWQNRTVVSSGASEFRWGDDYAFCWGKMSSLAPGAVFNVSQKVVGDDFMQNSITLIQNQPQSYTFTNLMPSQPPGCMTINQGGGLPINTLGIGLARSGYPFCVGLARPFMTTRFFSGNTRLFIAMGDYVQGETLDYSQIQNKAEIVFPTGIYTLNATYNADGSWTIKP